MRTGPADSDGLIRTWSASPRHASKRNPDARRASRSRSGSSSPARQKRKVLASRGKRARVTSTRSSIVLGSAFVAEYSSGGGVFWVPLQYLLGLRALGVDAHWVELLWAGGDPERARRSAAVFLDRVREFGVADQVTLIVFPDGTRGDLLGRAVHHGLGPQELRARARDALLLNLSNSIPEPLRADFARTVLLDLDPGPFQIWARDCDLGVGRHDVHLTIGQRLGASDSPVPLNGVDWKRAWPTVHLPSWPRQEGAPRKHYTTVTQWWTKQYAVLDGEFYECNKRPGFVEMIDLPARVPVGLEMAANLDPSETEDRLLFAHHGWQLVDPNVVAGTPTAFREYVQGSRGEFSCAKPAYVKARSGWVSDRTICYLASGRPCVVQATGAENELPPSAGLRFFHCLDEAAEALAKIEADYPRAAQAAHRLAEEVFATDVVLPGLLASVGA